MQGPLTQLGTTASRREAAPAKLTQGSLFTGIGGLDLGLGVAGFKTVWMVEQNPFCLRVLNEHWPNVPKFTDVRECGKHNLKQVDVITGGYPCQDHSIAGTGRGLGTPDSPTERSGLWFHYLRIVRELRPRWVLIENVYQLLRTKDGDRVVSGMEEEGYSCWPHVLDAGLLGAPHRRQRAWIYDLRELAARRGYQVVHEFTDVGSGSKSRRAGLDALLADAHRRRFDIVLVAAFDRVARSVKHFLTVVDELGDLGIEFVSSRENIDTSGPMGRMFIVMVSSIAELERSLIVERIKAGMRRRRLEGYRLGRAPLDVDRDAIVRDRLSGSSLTATAKKHGISRASVVRFVHEARRRSAAVEQFQAISANAAVELTA